MIHVVKQFRAEVAHRLPSHDGQCRNLHGHTYKFEIGFTNNLEAKRCENGMVCDFGDIKRLLVAVIEEKLDHGTILMENDPLLKDCPALSRYTKLVIIPSEPTAEYMAAWIADLLAQRTQLSITFVRVWETPTSYAEWRNQSCL